MKPDAAQPIAEQFASREQQALAATLGVWIFLGTELMFFGPLFFGYFYGRLHFPQGFADASRHTEVWLGTINTAVLLTSSLFMVLAAEQRKAGNARAATRLLWITAALGIVFLVIKGSEYAIEWREHLFPGPRFALSGAQAGGAEIFFYLYFAMTALHALHLTAGIVLTGVFAVALGRNATRFASGERIELVGLYWHFVDLIWVFLYPILYLVGRSGG
ncbi:cytochrome c oxidase subunit 3 [Noviherbaspirillum massiliense]|uniref:cytochrome c oxidase subunit 3 n=1 Tax=Noviherbaspirillum massiliense TaxID=1465823 RepID=UPI0003142E7D|nr:cytochrome c oxidase subunit 3 [Noviherbaspirillum massiliense]